MIALRRGVVLACLLAHIGCAPDASQPPTLVAGQRCCYRDIDGPWPHDTCLDPSITIHEVKDGWVRYARHSFPVSRMTIEGFHRFFVCQALTIQETP